jgi:hypothetical protein
MMNHEFRKILEKSPLEEKWSLIRDTDVTLLDEDLFDWLVFQLEDIDYKIRFFALFCLIDKFPKKLSEPNDKLVNIMMKLLIDKSTPIVDRAAWALSIMGEFGLKKLLESTITSDLKLRQKVIWAIGSNANLNLKKDESISILLNGLQDENEVIRFTSMCALINVSPLGMNKYYMIEDYDFKEIYKNMKPVAKSFMESENAMYNDFAKRYFKMIEQEEKNKRI